MTEYDVTDLLNHLLRQVNGRERRRQADAEIARLTGHPRSWPALEEVTIKLPEQAGVEHVLLRAAAGDVAITAVVTVGTRAVSPDQMADLLLHITECVSAVPRVHVIQQLAETMHAARKG